MQPPSNCLFELRDFDFEHKNFTVARGVRKPIAGRKVYLCCCLETSDRGEAVEYG